MRSPEEIKRGLECCIGDDEDVCCYGCAYCGEIRCVRKMTDDTLALIQQIESQVPRWISVEERLPEDDEMYLVYTTEHTCAVYRYWGDGEWETEWGEDASHDITHWMPLPEAPKEE